MQIWMRMKNGSLSVARVPTSWLKKGYIKGAFEVRNDAGRLIQVEVFYANDSHPYADLYTTWDERTAQYNRSRSK